MARRRLRVTGQPASNRFPTTTDEEGMLQTTRSLVERWSPVLDIDEDNVRVTPSTPGGDGQPVGVSGLGQSVAGIPLYLVGSLVSQTVPRPYADFTQRLFVGWTKSVVTAAGVALVFLLAGLLGAARRWAVALALGYGLATMVWATPKRSSASRSPPRWRWRPRTERCGRCPGSAMLRSASSTDDDPTAGRRLRHR